MLFAFLVAVFLCLSYIIVFPRTKGVLRPLKVPVDMNKE
jgi:hypothetical protein